MSNTFNFSAIGHIRSPFRAKFGVARQSMMLSEARGILKLVDEPAYQLAVTRLEEFSHLWVVFVFHKNEGQAWRPLIEAPRVDMPTRVGVLASRSPHRPNPIGLSVLKIEKIDRHALGGIEIHLSGLDLLDGTPVLDIKPYLAYADSFSEASSGWASSEIPKYPVSFSEESLATLNGPAHEEYSHLKELLIQMLELDPRPTAQRKAFALNDRAHEGKKFAFRVANYDVQWHIEGGGIKVDRLLPC